MTKQRLERAGHHVQVHLGPFGATIAAGATMLCTSFCWMCSRRPSPGRTSSRSCGAACAAVRPWCCAAAWIPTILKELAEASVRIARFEVGRSRRIHRHHRTRSSSARRRSHHDFGVPLAFAHPRAARPSAGRAACRAPSKTSATPATPRLPRPGTALAWPTSVRPDSGGALTIEQRLARLDRVGHRDRTWLLPGSRPAS